MSSFSVSHEPGTSLTPRRAFGPDSKRPPSETTRHASRSRFRHPHRPSRAARVPNHASSGVRVCARLVAARRRARGRRTRLARRRDGHVVRRTEWSRPRRHVDLYGSCKYGSNIPSHYVAALNTDGALNTDAAARNFNSENINCAGGYDHGLTDECGACYEVMCVAGRQRGLADSALGPWAGCANGDGEKSITVLITDSCPCGHPNPR